jgi:hypothetical protein
MNSSTTVTMPGNRGQKIIKSTGLDNSSMDVGKDVSQLKRKDFGGGKDDLSHSITSGKVPAGN